jgi:hypothetical protein
MNPLFSKVSLATLLTAAALPLHGADKNARPTPAPANSTPATAAAEAPIPQSVFTIPPTPKDGRNPFYPMSGMKPPVPDPRLTTPQKPVYTFTLNGITSPPRRTAMINSRTFEPGEEGEVRLSDGQKKLIKCLEIGDNYAVILVDGQQRVLKLRAD